MATVETPSQDYRRTRLPAARPLRKGLEAFLDDLSGWRKRHGSLVRRWGREADRVLYLMRETVSMSDRQVRQRIDHHRTEVLRRGGKRVPVEDLEALALVAESAHRAIGLRPYREQIMGALGLREGFLVEMATGEGKTLTLALAMILAAWDSRPCHIITANDYLAERDATEMQPLYASCGLFAGFVTGTMAPEERQKNYACGITYTTSKELVADFLRDRIAMGDMHEASRRALWRLRHRRMEANPGVVMRGLHHVFVDEADYILIDEAVTPLIISRPRPNPLFSEACVRASEIASTLVRERDYTVDTTFQDLRLRSRAEQALAAEPERLPVMRNPRWKLELVEQALRAREFYQRGVKYVVQEDKVVIVDEGTGRLMPNRTWRQGLHQAIEVKEGLSPTDPSETVAGISFQRFFRLVPQLAGVTGTAMENAREFWRIYHLPVVPLPTHRPCIRRYFASQVTVDVASKWEKVLAEIEAVHATGRPVLVGTRSVGASEELAALLDQRGLSHQLLNAVNHRQEANIIAHAGTAGSITIATNMAGRGTDIRLFEGVAGEGGLHVVATEFHEAGRVDRQLYGRCARQGDPGSVRQFLSLEDDLAKRFLPKPVRRTLQRWLRSGLPMGTLAGNLGMRWAQRAATRRNFKARLSVLRQDRWTNDSLSFSGGPRGI